MVIALAAFDDLTMPDRNKAFQLIICIDNIHGMNLRKIDLNLLTVFEAVYEDRNFTRAAERLGMTQPALSNAIKRLRGETGDKLFVRASGGVEPTPRADALAPHIATALNHVRMAMAEHGPFDPKTSSKRFKVCLGDFGEALVLPRLFKAIDGAPARMRVTAVGGTGRDHLNDLRSGALDLVWDFISFEDGHVLSEPVFEDNLVCIMRKEHPLANQELTAENFMQLRHIVVRPTQVHVQAIEKVLRKAALERDVAVEVDHVMSMPFIAANTDYVSITAVSVAGHLDAGLGLVAKPLPFEVQPVCIYQSWHRRMQEDPAHQWLRQSLRDATATFVAESHKPD